ncbi:UMP kinase [Kribbella sandramycini]|uniref:Uridylate kinase n=1 Tax=Kribbella sandramycini TaxID=60450 RepID=A0A7Y4NYF4_9ACTN|nr:UMP kinase [Kribbella sandramycini]MBB6569252.1 uridylate kinase [Kribbella sandramycini]NOL40907.1 UMP kinase [Kribbella sandramycini]
MYRRLVLKLSGQAIAGGDDFGFDSARLTHLANEVIALRATGVQVAVIVGGGNVFRGNRAEDWGIDRVEADNIGMLGTVINAVLLRGRLAALGAHGVRLMTAVPINNLAEPYIRLRALRHLEKGSIIVLAGGNGQPFTTTDYPAVQRAVELEADALLVAKNGTDGVYDADPNKSPGAKRFDRLGYQEVIDRGLGVMDQSAFILARDHRLPLHVFDIDRPSAAAAISTGAPIGTLIN